jgi:hypothetical protein
VRVVVVLAVAGALALLPTTIALVFVVVLT